MKIKPKQNKTLLPAIAALTGGLAAAPAAAIELGEIQVHSALGQPLRASIAYALGPSETLYDFCISLSQAQASSGMPSVRNAKIGVANGVISLTGNRAVSEPLVTTRVIVDCPYTAHISREYMMFIDPPGSVMQPIAAPVAAAPVQSAQPVAEPRPVQSRRVARVETGPVENATRYRVQPGDTLSGIAERIENRPVGLWDAVNQIFATNPDAFIDGDLNKLKAGSWLDIPDFGAGAPQVADNVAAPVADLPVVPVEESAGTYEPTVTDAEPAIDEASMATPEPAAAPLVPDSGEAVADTGELKPGDILIDTQLEAPEVTAESPNVPTASISRPAPVAETGSSYAWLIWLAGAGLALIAGLLMFGRRGRETYDAPPAQAAAGQPMRRKTDLEPTDTTEIPIVVAEADDYDLDDDSPTAENLALDADLVIGTGLSDGVDVDVAEDFAFASTSALDLELPDEMSSNTGTHNTDIIPPMMVEDTSIVVDEVFPEEEEDDFDMSVVVDATKVPHPEETTEKDLKAVVIDDLPQETLISDSYTLSQEVDYKILEQDYEDEMTATQKLSAEIAKAAEELAERMEFDDDSTEEMPLATVTELDVTAQLPAKNDDVISDLDDTGINEEITVNIEAEEKTVEMVAGDSDKTVEMEVESGKVDTKAS